MSGRYVMPELPEGQYWQVGDTFASGRVEVYLFEEVGRKRYRSELGFGMCPARRGAVVRTAKRILKERSRLGSALVGRYEGGEELR